MGRLPLVAMVLWGLACGCRSNAGVSETEKETPPAPLEAATLGTLTLPHRLPLGAKEKRAVVVALTESSQSCVDFVARRELSDVFVLCSSESFDKAEPALKDALRKLKKAYPKHLPSSLALVVAKPNIERELDMALAEASVFDRVLVVSESTARLSSVYVSTYGERGGKKLFVVARAPDVGARLALSSGGSGVRTRQFSGGYEEIGTALGELLR